MPTHLDWYTSRTKKMHPLHERSSCAYMILHYNRAPLTLLIFICQREKEAATADIQYRRKHAAAFLFWITYIAGVELRVARCCFSKTIRREMHSRMKKSSSWFWYREMRTGGRVRAAGCAGRRLKKGSDFSGAIFFPDPWRAKATDCSAMGVGFGCWRLTGRWPTCVALQICPVIWKLLEAKKDQVKMVRSGCRMRGVFQN